MARKGENIRKRKDGRWEGRYTSHSTGSARVHSVYARTYREAKAKLIAAKETVNAAETVKSTVTGSAGASLKQDGEKRCFDSIAKGWLEKVRQTKKHSTYIKYGQSICIMLKLLFLINAAPIFRTSRKILKTAIRKCPLTWNRAII